VTESYKTWCIFGKFNIVKRVSERKVINIKATYERYMNELNVFKGKVKLLAIPIVGRNKLVAILIVGKKYIPYRSNKTTKRMLDRILVSNE